MQATRLTSQRVTADVLRTRWSIPTVFRRAASTDTIQTPRTVPSASSQGRVTKKPKKPTPIDDGHHATPSNGCDQSLFLESLGHLTHHPTLPSHRLLVLPLPFIIHNPPSHLLPSFGSPGSSLHLASDQRRLDVLFTLCTQSLRLWVYHRDFGATFSVIYGK